MEGFGAIPVFLAVVENGGFSAAARTLNLVVDGDTVSSVLGISIPALACPSISFQGFTVATDIYTATFYEGTLNACPEPALRGAEVSGTMNSAIDAPGLERFYACMTIFGSSAFGVAATLTQSSCCTL